MLNVSNVRCQQRQHPLGIDTPKPFFSWQLESDRRNTLQTAYQMQVARDPEFRSKVWDTVSIPTEASQYVAYEGPDLEPCTQYFMRVMVWDNHNRHTRWSEPLLFETAFFDESGWQGHWISLPQEQTDGSQPAPYLRKEFAATGAVKRARIYATALGVYQLQLNGEPVGDQVLAPGWTNYNQRLQYQIYDVTELLQAGDNALGAILGDGWYRGYIGFKGQKAFYGDQLALRLELHITYADDSQELVVTDSSWKGSEGPIVMSDIYNGEIYDARREEAGWDEASFADDHWTEVTVLSQPTEARLVAQELEPVRRIQEINPIRLIRTPAGHSVLDFGQNMVGRVGLQVQGPAGTEITLEHAEVLDADGNFYTENLRSAKQKVTYILKGASEPEVYEPHFTFQGFRYVRVTGVPGPISLSSFTALVLHSDIDVTGQFFCSAPLLNQLQQNILWGQRGNFVDVPTDCPQRDERLGWTGDAQMFATTAAFNMFSLNFFRKWLRDLASEQLENGGVPFVIPNVLGDDAHSSAAWGDAATIIPWTLYLYYGDHGVLTEQYPSMKAWVEYIRSQSKNNLWNSGFHFGDWLSLDAPANSTKGGTCEDFIATAFYYHSTRLLIRVAEVLEKSNDVKEYTRLAGDIRKAFQREFVTRTGRLAVPSQTAHVLALMFDLVDDEQAPRLVEWLVKDIEKHDIHLATGFVGTPYLLFVLSKYGHTELAYSLLMQTDYPSWLYPVTKGATTIWERWNGLREDGSFETATMNSFNHYAYGAVGDWLYRRVCGLEPVEDSPGFKRFRVRPHLSKRLRFAQADFASLYGLCQAGWERLDDGTVLNVTVPPNTTAAVRVPAPASEIREGNRPLKEVKELLGIHKGERNTVLDIGSGDYAFWFPNRDNDSSR